MKLEQIRVTKRSQRIFLYVFICLIPSDLSQNIIFLYKKLSSQYFLFLFPFLIIKIMGNTCQTSQNLAPSANLKDYHNPQKHQSKPNLSLPQAQIIIKPIILPYYGKYSKSTSAPKHQKRGYKQLSNLSLQLGDRKTQIKMRKTLKQIHHILTLDLNLTSYSQDFKRQFTNFVSSLKKYSKEISNLQINYANLPDQNWKILLCS